LRRKRTISSIEAQDCSYMLTALPPLAPAQSEVWAITDSTAVAKESDSVREWLAIVPDGIVTIQSPRDRIISILDTEGDTLAFVQHIYALISFQYSAASPGEYRHS
jgi:hypothetical protein